MGLDSNQNRAAGDAASPDSSDRPAASRYGETSAPQTAVFSGAAAPDLYAFDVDLPAIPLDWTKIWLVLAIGGVAFATFFLTSLSSLVQIWLNDASWGHGFVVPLISLFLIYIKWDILKRLPLQGSRIGLLILLLGVGGQVLFRATGTGHMSNLSMMVVLYGLVLFVFGWNHLKILWLPISFLVFMIPPPGPLYVAMTTPMQIIAAELGIRLCPLFGISAIRSGVQISVEHAGKWEPLTVAEACSGMRMLIAFFALAVALAYSTSRPVWQKLTLAACALPVAIFCNALRVAITGVAVARGGQEWASGSTHEYVGLAMLAPAMAMQIGLGRILDKVYIDEPENETPAPSGGAT